MRRSSSSDNSGTPATNPGLTRPSGYVPHGGPLPSPPQQELPLPLTSALCILACLLIGTADALTHGQYSLPSLLLVLMAAAIAWAASSHSFATIVLPPSRARLFVAITFLDCLLAAIRFRGGLYGTGVPLAISIALVIAAAAAALLAATLGLVNQALLISIVLIGGAAVAMIISSPAPLIDTWEMLQAAARGLLAGHNLYTQHWRPHLPGQATAYGYFPGPAVVLAPFYALFRDVRYGILLSTLTSAVLIARISRHPLAAVFGTLFLLYPYFTFSIEQSWIEPITLLTLLLLAWSLRRHKTGYATLLLAALLTFQQYSLIFVPLVAASKGFGIRRTALSLALSATFTLPWVIATPHLFFHAAILYSLHYVFAYQSLSLFHLLADLTGGLGYVALVLGMLLALTISMVRIRKDASFLMGCSVTLVTLNLFNKISRFNEWELAAGLILAAGAEALTLSTLREDIPPPYS